MTHPFLQNLRHTTQERAVPPRAVHQLPVLILIGDVHHALVVDHLPGGLALRVRLRQIPTTSGVGERGNMGNRTRADSPGRSDTQTFPCPPG
jgi:hypothetical protein